MMFEYRRTPFLAIVYAAVIGTAVTALVEVPERPLTVVQMCVFYLLSYLPGLGLSMLSDPAPRKIKQEYLKIDFYAPKASGGTGDPAGRVPGIPCSPQASQDGGTA
jgi:hypothetical protein